MRAKQLRKPSSSILPGPWPSIVGAAIVPTSAHVADGAVLTVPVISTASRPHTLPSLQGVDVGAPDDTGGGGVVGESVWRPSRFAKLSTRPSTTMTATTTADPMTFFEGPGRGSRTVGWGGACPGSFPW